jgi:hypothetical protein
MAPGAVRVLFVASHPVQYASPQFRLYGSDPRLEVTVAYCSLEGAEAYLDRAFEATFAWNVPLLDGYRWELVPSLGPRSGPHGALGLVNPGLWSIIRRNRFDLVVSYIGYRSVSAWITIVAAKLRRVPLVLTIDAHELRSIDGKGWKVPLKQRLLPIIFGLADGTFVSSTRTRAYLDSLGVRTPVFLTPNVVDTSFFRKRGTAADPGARRRAWGVPPKAFVALFAGKLVLPTCWMRSPQCRTPGRSSRGTAACVSNLRQGRFDSGSRNE